MPRTRYDVFLSYRRADTALVQPLRDELLRLGYRVFFDTQSIEGGDNWKNRLQTAVAASRVLVLCWSENASRSEVVTFEYASAQALHKPLVPWLLDHTHLPVMLDHINGIPNPDPVQVAAALRPLLGRTLVQQRAVQCVLAAIGATGIGFSMWFALKPPPPAPPWEFHGEVIDPVTRVGIGGVEVDATPEHGAASITHTDAAGRYDFHFQAPQSNTMHLVFRKEGYAGDEVTVPSTKPFQTDLVKVH